MLAWVKRQGKGYQTRINGYLREAMLRSAKKPGKVGIRKKRSAS
ncbi:MAG: BrnA antitoxin family protein [Terriglobales bacterium]